MRFLFRWAFRLFLVLTVLVVALVLLKDTLLRSFAEHRIRAETGMDVKIGNLQSGLFSPTLTIENFKLYNRQEYGGSPFLDIPDLHVECYAGSLATGTFRFKLVRIQIFEMNIVENREGRTNLVAVMEGFDKAHSGNHPSLAGFDFGGIDLLNFSLGKVNYSSLRRPEKTTEIQMDVRNEIITGIKTLPELTDLLLNVVVRKGIRVSTAKRE